MGLNHQQDAHVPIPGIRRLLGDQRFLIGDASPQRIIGDGDAMEVAPASRLADDAFLSMKSAPPPNHGVQAWRPGDDSARPLVQADPDIDPLDSGKRFYNSRNMESKSAIEALSALAHEGRLAAFRLLVKAGDEGLPAGELARLLEVPANTLSTNLGILSRAGLITSHRDGRSIIYAANYGGMSKLTTFLMEDCCKGRAEVCAPVDTLALTL